MKPAYGKVKNRLAALLATVLLLAFNHPLLAQPNNVGQAQSTQPIQLKGPIPLPASARPVTPPAPTPQTAGAQPAKIPATTTTDNTDIDNLDATHAQNSTLSMEQLRLDSALKPEQFKPIQLEVSFDQLITLQEALKYALENNLAIKISKDNLNYQRYVLYGQIANALPNLSMAYNLTHTDIMNEHVTSLAKVFLTRVTYPVFQGGSVAYSILGQYYRERGWKQAYRGSINDELLDLYQKYNNLLLSRSSLADQRQSG